MNYCVISIEMKKEPSKKENPKQAKKEKLTLAKEESEKPFDFGGLPQRDLKKNLGCG